jgi:hypothetical protein
MTEKGEELRFGALQHRHCSASKQMDGCVTLRLCEQPQEKKKKTLITSALNQVGISEITDIAALCFPVREHRLWLRLRVIQARSLISRLS